MYQKRKDSDGRVNNSRPPKYNPTYHIPWVKSLAREGKTVDEIAEAFGVARSTVFKWAQENEDFSDALNEGRGQADAQVEESLYMLTKMRTVTEKKTIISAGEMGQQKPVRVEVTEKEVLPNPSACIFWLKNRQPTKWRDKQEVSLNTDGDSIQQMEQFFERKRNEK